MPKIRDFRADFRRGRTGGAIQVRQSSNAYSSSVRDALNMMVLADGRIARRWGTYACTDGSLYGIGTRRIVPFECPSNNTNYMIIYNLVAGSNQNDIKVYAQDKYGNLFETTLHEVGYNENLAVTTDSIFDAYGNGSNTWLSKISDIDYLNFVPVEDKLLVIDNSIHPIWIEPTTTAATIVNSNKAGYNDLDSVKRLKQVYFEFDSNDDGTKKAPFYNFEKTIELTPNIFTIAGLSSGFNNAFANLSQFTSGQFDLPNGTGKVTASADFFTSDHVGQNMQLLDGEFEITAITNATEASIKVHKNICAKLDNNPFLMKKNKKQVEVFYFNHGLQKGDQIFLIGVSADDESNTVLTKALQTAIDTTSITSNASFGAYTVDNVIDLDTFVITGAANATNDALIGGNSVYLFRLGGIKGVKEEAFSNTRGWPTCAVMHERRLWVAGTTSLPNAIWASQFGDVQNFDTGEGNLTDAIAMYGVGDEAVFIRHMISGFDLIIMSDNAEMYVPGSTTEAISQSTVRVVRATEHGSSYTEPAKFDGGIFFVDKNGKEIREFITDTRITDYHAIPSSIVIPDWVKFPKKTAVYMGALEVQTTPYMFFADQEDGSMICMHSARTDDSFGFMRWKLDFGDIKDVVTLGEHLYIIAERQKNNGYVNGELVPSGSYERQVLKFDTNTKNYITTDFSGLGRYITGGSPSYAFGEFDFDYPSYVGTGIYYASSRYIYLYSNSDGGYHYGEHYVQNANAIAVSDIPNNRFEHRSSISDPELITFVYGDRMTAYVKLHAPIAQLPNGTRIGKKQRLVSTDVSFEGTTDGIISGREIVKNSDKRESVVANLSSSGKDFVNPIDEWREIYTGEWTRDPVLEVRAEKTGVLIIRGMSLNVYV